MSREQIEELGFIIRENSPLSTISSQNLAEVILEEGYCKQSDNVIELPCKVGDKIYQADETRIYESTINEITLYTQKTLFVTENVAFDETAIGKGIFLTQKEAEAKMKGDKQ